MIFVSPKFLRTGTIDFTIWSITSNPRIQEPFASMTFKTAFMPNSIFRRYSICMIDKTWRKNRPRFDGFFIIQKRNTYYILNIIYLHNADSLGHREPELCDQLWMEWYDRFCKYQKNTFIIFVFFHTWIRYIIFFYFGLFENYYRGFLRVFLSYIKLGRNPGGSIFGKF